jgi:hypothetical protein
LNNLFTANHFNELLTPYAEEKFRNDAICLFRKQAKENSVYQEFLAYLNCKFDEVTELTQIPFLPISFFKTRLLQTGTFTPDVFFESSGTTSSVNSRHGIKSLGHYLNNTVLNFTEVYGSLGKYCFLALLPSYLERGNSSLVAMTDHFIQESGHADSGFFLYNLNEMVAKLLRLEAAGQPTILIGVTYALLELAEQYTLQLQNTIVMETGGMKGRKKEITRTELHSFLMQQLGVKSIHAEYGMTELQSQAYSTGEGLFYPSSTMRVILRSPDDPYELWTWNQFPGRTGVINIIDLANTDTQAFIATDDLGRFTGNGGFEVLGRLDNCDIRGCSLLTL